jgi:outer membrane protein assembly factor BamA
MADIAHQLLPSWKSIVPHDSSKLQRGGRFVSLIPQIGYTLQTNFLAMMLVNVAFQRPDANMSTVIASAAYTANKQAILALTSAVWSPKNRLTWAGDWRLMHYPQASFGLGIINTSLSRQISMDYEYLRINQRVLKRIGPNLYGGFGYALDLHWNIVSRNQNRDVVAISHYRYGVEGRSISSGPLVSLQFDNRTNPINPIQGYYARLNYRPSLQLMGSDQNYQSLLIEGRTYLQPSAHSQNVLAVWSYNALTLSGNPPFLDLPSTGWDTYGNTGRGYVQGRYRGKNLLYLETEYRFGLTRNRLLGGVVFANAQTVTEVASKSFQRVAPAIGAGLRLNMNKIARTNLAIDYAFGVGGSHGLFFNFGEVF